LPEKLKIKKKLIGFALKRKLSSANIIIDEFNIIARLILWVKK